MVSGGVMAVKTLLIYPYIKNAVPTVPIGLAYLAGMLLKHSYPVKIIDTIAEQMDDRELARAIKDYNPDIIGISAMFSEYAFSIHNTAKVSKTALPGAKVVLGGSYASTLLLKDENVDCVVQGEGEMALLDIVRGSQVRHIQAPYIKDLDTIPFPARELLPMAEYFKFRSPYVLRNPATSVITSRGCPRHCIYCSIHSVWGKYWRKRSVENVVDEIELLKDLYGIREINFNDDNISVDHLRMNEICDELIKRNLDIKWTMPNGIALWTLNEELIKKMRQAGCYRLTFGIETGNKRMQKYICKNIDLDYARQVIKWANDAGIWTISTNILGFPTETRQEINDTVDFAISSGVDFALFYNLTIFKGAVVEKLEPVKFNADEIRQIQAEAYRRFIRSRLNVDLGRLVKKLYSFEMVLYFLRLVMMFISIGIRLIKFRQMKTSLMYKWKI
uniref:Putative radical SAM superfamily protein n=1 Tax=viral metagenome TaxID=1070528 RepID=A0A6H1ZSR2_9ZZZZ